MKKISAILPVYNEEKLLPGLLENIEPHVDEIVIIDGGPEGPSTDMTAEIAQGIGEKVIYRDGKFKAVDGAWDMALQRNTAVSNATGQILLLVSADMRFHRFDLLCECMLMDENHRMYFCSTIEFWLDTKHLRLYSDDGNTASTIPSGILELLAVDRSLDPYYADSGGLQIGEVEPTERALLPECTKLHLGWIRGFRDQVEKHVRHVKQRRWGDMGDQLLKDETGRQLRGWAISHVLSYPRIPSVDYIGTQCDGFEHIADMKYNDGYEEVLKDFEDEYGISVFKLHGGRG